MASSHRPPAPSPDFVPRGRGGERGQDGGRFSGLLRARERAGLVAFLFVAGATVLAGGVFVSVAVERWENFQTNAFDLGFFDQILFSYLDGRPGRTSFISYNFHGQHLEPILAVFLVPYALGASPLFLMVAQAVVAAGAAVPLYFGARRFGLGLVLAAVLSLAYLANPYLHRAVEFDFHPEVMVALPAFASLWAIGAGRFRLGAVLALATLLFKEDAAFVAVALAAVLWTRGARREATWTAGAAVAWAALAVLVVMPLAREGAESDLLLRYGHLTGASSQSELVRTLAMRPWVIPEVMVAPAQLWTAALFLVVSAPLAVFQPRTLVLLLPGLLIALLADHDAQRVLGLHYSANLLVVAVICGVVGARAATRRVPLGLVAAVVVVPVLAGFVVQSPFRPGAAEHDGPSRVHREAVLGGLAVVPAESRARVSAQSGLVPRLSQRRDIHEFPRRALESDWVVVDRYGQISRQALETGYEAVLAEVRAAFERAYSADGVEVFRRRE